MANLSLPLAGLDPPLILAGLGLGVHVVVSIVFTWDSVLASSVRKGLGVRPAGSQVWLIERGVWLIEVRGLANRSEGLGAGLAQEMVYLCVCVCVSV